MGPNTWSKKFLNNVVMMHTYYELMGVSYGVQGGGSNKLEQSYWSRGVNWTEGFQTRVQVQEVAKRGVSYMASFWGKTLMVQTKKRSSE